MKHSLKVTFFLLSLFLLSQLVGLEVLDNYVDSEKSSVEGKPVYKDLPYDIQRPDVKPELSVWMIVVAILVGTTLLLLLIRFRQIAIWKVWFFSSVLLTLSISLSSFIQSTAAFAISLLLSLWKVLKPNAFIHNFTEIFIYGGLAAIFVPLLNIAAASLLLLLISAYDAYAVWKSKHMVKMAKFQTESKLFSGLYFPSGQPSARSSAKGKSTAAVLGGGDMGFPLIFAGVVMKTYGFQLALIIPAFTALSLLGLMILGERNRFYPAMPFLSAACFLGYGVVWLLG